MFAKTNESLWLVTPSPDERVVPDGVSRRIAFVIAAGCICVCVLALTGWWLDIDLLVRARAGLSSMKPITAIGLGLSAISLGLLALGERSRCSRAAGLGTAWLGVLCGLALAFEWIAGIKPGFEVVLFRSMVERETIAVPGRPSYATVTAITLLGAALIAVRRTSRAALLLAQTMIVLIVMMCVVALVGYITGVRALYAFRPYSTMALYTAATALALAIGVCAATPSRGLAAIALGRDAGGRVSRRLLPICLGVPVLLGFGVLKLETAGFLDDRIGLGIALVGTAMLCSLAVVAVARALRHADAQRAEAERRIDRMMSELDHRVKNTMAIVISLCDLTADGSRSLPEFQEAYRGRLSAMARTHEALAAMRWKGVDLRFILDAVVVGFAPARRECLSIEGGSLVLPPHVALPMAVTLHELATNALKHGAWCAGSAEGRVTVAWRVSDDGELLLDWTERNGPAPDAGAPQGFGMSLIRSMIPHEMRGSVDVTMGAEGLTCRVRAPVQGSLRQTVRHVA